MFKTIIFCILTAIALFALVITITYYQSWPAFFIGAAFGIIPAMLRA